MTRRILWMVTALERERPGLAVPALVGTKGSLCLREFIGCFSHIKAKLGHWESVAFASGGR